MYEQVRVFVSATVANVGPGFDILGFAIDEPGDEVVVRRSNTPGVTIKQITGDGERLPLAAGKNTVGVAAWAILKHLGEEVGIEIDIHKKMPLSSGLGSSAASAAAGAYAVNALLGEPLNSEELIPFAMEGEKIASGDYHADNVAPALLGGFVLIRSCNPLDIVHLPVALDLYCTVICPDIEVNTAEARKMLPQEIPLVEAVQQWGNIAGLVAGLTIGDYDLLSRSMHDVIIEPVRATLVPNFYEIKQIAVQCGALGCCLSGSGPAIFALCQDEDTANEIASQWQSKGTCYTSKINTTGPTIIDRR